MKNVPETWIAPAVIYRSRSDDPYFNCACEEFFLRDFSGPETILFIYCNRPSVIVGRNQNPWLECSPPDLYVDDIPVVRRGSGGGTVYHDYGNCNFALIGARTAYRPNRHLELAGRVLRRFGLTAEITERRGIVCGQKKVSGSAFTITGNRVMQHGTMLISSDLEQLRKSLRRCTHDSLVLTGKAVRSVPDPVANLVAFNPAVTMDKFILALALEFCRWQHSDGEIESVEAGPWLLRFPVLAGYLEKYRASSWLVGRTPAFRAGWRTSHRAGMIIEWRAEGRRGCLHRIEASCARGRLPGWAVGLAEGLTGVEFWPEPLAGRLEQLIEGERDSGHRRQVADFSRQLLGARMRVPG